MITHLEPDILECEVKWVLESITRNKGSGSDGIPVELFQILIDDVVKVLHSICQQIWKTQQWPQEQKRSVFIPIPKKGNDKTYSNYSRIAVELFLILKDDAVKVLHSICQQIWKLISGHRTGKGQFSFQSQRKAMTKNAQTTAQLHSSQCQQSNAQNSPSQASTGCETRTS